jgi:hypothetical protein
MRQFGWGVVLASLVFGVFALLLSARRDDEGAPARSVARDRMSRQDADPRVGDNARRLRDLQADVERLESELAGLRAAVRTSFTLPTNDADGAGPATLLDRFLLSFADGGRGSEYFRLAVDAHAPLLVEHLARLIADPTQSQDLRVQLIGILGTERFKGDGRVVDALLGLLHAESPLEIAKPVLDALAATADGAAIPALERYAGEVPWSNLPYEIYDAIAAIAGSERNAVLRRLLNRARDDVSRTLVLDRIDRADPEGAFLLFTDAWTLDPAVRAAAATRLGDFRTEEFKRFVEEKLAAETDPEVRKSLERARAKQGEIPDFDAMQAAGAPNAEPNVDDPAAWASSRGDMGLQWLELSYRTPLRANRLRIFEVNSAGAIVEVQTVDSSGQRRTVWRGTDPTIRPGVFDLRIDATPYRVARVRLILDTSRRPGWNEIDAVELVGPDGRAWAASAVASSNYGD